MFAVIRGDNSTYFYFPGEFTFPKLIKWKDIEPARILQRKIGEACYDIVLTRVHYWCLIIWINPDKHNSLNGEKPVIYFKWNFHTPHLYKQSALKQRFDILGGRTLGKKEKLVLTIAMGSFDSDSRHAFENPRDYPGMAQEIRPRVVGQDQLFDTQAILNNSAKVILVGTSQEINSILTELTEVGAGITTKKIQEFLEGSGQSNHTT